MTVYAIHVCRPTGLKQLSSSSIIELERLIWLLHSDTSGAEQHSYVSGTSTKYRRKIQGSNNEMAM
jgi:hypothetical protein